MITVHKMEFLLPCNKTTKKLRLILTNFYYKPFKRVANRNFEFYRRNFTSMSFMGNSNRMCKGRTNFRDLKWHITESVP
jgi:hypothetical protein